MAKKDLLPILFILPSILLILSSLLLEGCPCSPWPPPPSSLSPHPPVPAFRADLDAGHYLKVLAEAEARLRQDGNNAAAWAAKSQAFSSLQRFPEARAAADRAMALKPGLADALLARGLARAGEAIRQRDLGSLRGALSAMDDLRAATEADPTLAPAWTSLGLAYEMLPGILGGSTKKALRAPTSCAAWPRSGRPAPGPHPGGRGQVARSRGLLQPRPGPGAAGS